MLYLTMPKNINGLGIIAVIPVLIIIYSILFAVGGGVLGLFVYNSILLLKRLKNNLPK